MSVSTKPGQTAFTVRFGARIFGGERAGQADGAMLGGDIGRGIGEAVQAGHRGDGDDPARLGREQIGERRLAAMEHAVEIDREHARARAPPSTLAKGTPARGAGIVDEDRDRPVRRAGGGEGGVDLGAVGDVGGEAVGAELLRAAAPIRLTVGAFGFERGGDGGADAGAAAGDDRMAARRASCLELRFARQVAGELGHAAEIWAAARRRAR